MGDITITEAQAEEMAATLRTVAGITMDADHAFTLTALAVYLEVAVEEQPDDAND